MEERKAQRDRRQKEDKLSDRLLKGDKEKDIEQELKDKYLKKEKADVKEG